MTNEEEKCEINNRNPNCGTCKEGIELSSIYDAHCCSGCCSGKNSQIL